MGKVFLIYFTQLLGPLVQCRTPTSIPVSLYPDRETWWWWLILQHGDVLIFWGKGDTVGLDLHGALLLSRGTSRITEFPIPWPAAISLAGQKRKKEPFSFSPPTTAAGLWVPQCTYSPLGPCHHPGGTDGVGLGSIPVGLEEQREGRTSSRSGALSAMGSPVTQTRNFWG